MDTMKHIPFENHLIHGDSTEFFVNYYCRKKYKRQLGINHPVQTALYKMGLISSKKFYNILLKDILKGMRKDRFERIAAEFAATILDYKICMPKVNTVLQLEECGETHIVQSDGLEAWVKPWCHKMGIQRVNAYHAVADEHGVLTGEIRR